MLSALARLSLLAAIALAGGCAPRAAVVPQLTLDRAPTVLTAPQTVDWSQQRIASGQLNRARQVHYQRRVLAYPKVGGPWFEDANGNNTADQAEFGLRLAAMGCSATDYSPNGPAAAYATSTASPLFNRVFFVTREGKFLQVDRAIPGRYEIGRAS